MPKPTQLVTIELPRPLWRQVKALLKSKGLLPVVWLSQRAESDVLRPLVKGGKQ